MAKDDYYVMCPFYKKDETVNIRCEGITKDSRLVLQFENKKQKNTYKDEYCRTEDYKKCKIRMMLEEKYK